MHAATAALVALLSLGLGSAKPPTAVEVADALKAAGVPITYDVTDTSKVERNSRVVTSAVTATETTDLDVSTYKSKRAREADAVRQFRNLARRIKNPGAIPYLAYATCERIQVEIADGLRATDPGPIAVQVQGILEQQYGPCPAPSRTTTAAQNKVSDQVCGALLDSGVSEVEATVAAGEVRSLGANPEVANAWRTAVIAVGTTGFPDALAALSAACRS